jgi:hypothetical protein
MESGQQRSNLTKLSESDLPLEESWQDMRGLGVYDIADEQIGRVQDPLRRQGNALGELPGRERRGLPGDRQEALSDPGRRG